MCLYMWQQWRGGGCEVHVGILNQLRGRLSHTHAVHLTQAPDRQYCCSVCVFSVTTVMAVIVLTDWKWRLRTRQGCNVSVRVVIKTGAHQVELVLLCFLLCNTQDCQVDIILLMEFYSDQSKKALISVVSTLHCWWVTRSKTKSLTVSDCRAQTETMKTPTIFFLFLKYLLSQMWTHASAASLL